jgi:flagellar secretion chaperone FliS
MTASPGELLVMLYDGLLQRVRAAKLSIEKDKPGLAGEHLGYAHDILNELIRCLDPDKSPELCENLLGLYHYCGRVLLRAIADLDSAACEEVYGLLRPMRDAWNQANENMKTGTMVNG